MLSFLFPSRGYSHAESLLLFALRLLFAGMLMWHGMGKLLNHEALASIFPNPLGLGSGVSLYLTIFAEVFCAAAVIIGVLTRLALLPMIFLMCIALFVVHNGDLMAAKELALLYLVVFVVLFLFGAGRYSLDYMIAVRLGKNRTANRDNNLASEAQPSEA